MFVWQFILVAHSSFYSAIFLGVTQFPTIIHCAFIHACPIVQSVIDRDSFLSLSLSHTHTHTHTCSLFSFIHSFTRSFSFVCCLFTFTRTHTHTHTHTHARLFLIHSFIQSINRSIIRSVFDRPPSFSRSSLSLSFIRSFAHPLNRFDRSNSHSFMHSFINWFSFQSIFRQLHQIIHYLQKKFKINFFFK